MGRVNQTKLGSKDGIRAVPLMLAFLFSHDLDDAIVQAIFRFVRKMQETRLEPDDLALLCAVLIMTAETVMPTSAALAVTGESDVELRWRSRTSRVLVRHEGLSMLLALLVRAVSLVDSAAIESFVQAVSTNFLIQMLGCDLDVPSVLITLQLLGVLVCNHTAFLTRFRTAQGFALLEAALAPLCNNDIAVSCVLHMSFGKQLPPTPLCVPSDTAADAAGLMYFHVCPEPSPPCFVPSAASRFASLSLPPYPLRPLRGETGCAQELLASWPTVLPSACAEECLLLLTSMLQSSCKLIAKAAVVGALAAEHSRSVELAAKVRRAKAKARPCRALGRFGTLVHSKCAL